MGSLKVFSDSCTIFESYEHHILALVPWGLVLAVAQESRHRQSKSRHEIDAFDTLGGHLAHETDCHDVSMSLAIFPHFLQEQSNVVVAASAAQARWSLPHCMCQIDERNDFTVVAGCADKRRSFHVIG